MVTAATFINSTQTTPAVECQVPLDPGTQVLYVPTHAMFDFGAGLQVDLKHPDIELGFVSRDRGAGDNGGTVFCHFFRKGMEPTVANLRNAANQEAAYRCNLLVGNYADQSIINACFVHIAHLKNEAMGQAGHGSATHW